MIAFEKTTSALRVAKRGNKAAVFFYEGGGRSKVLNQILHCVRFSPGVIALTGPTGSGRSLIIQSLVQSFKKEDESDLCLLSEESAVLETEEELYRALAEGFGLEQKSVEILEDLADRVQHFIRVGLRGKRNLLIAVDDAKQHSEEVLEILLQLVGSNKGLSLLLSGETSLLETLKQFHVQSLLIHQIALRPLLTEEAADFLRQYLKQQGVSDETAVSRKKLDELMSRTGGNLSLLVREAQQLVLSLQVHNKTIRTGLPIVHMAALVLVITITIMAFLYYPASTQNLPDPDDELQQPVVEVAEVPLQPLDVPKKNKVETISSETLPDNRSPSVIASLASVQGTPLSNGETVASEVEQQSLPVAVTNVSTTKAAAPNIKDKPHADFPDHQQAYTLQEQELLDKPKANMTLQVSNLSSEKAVKAFIQRCSASDATQLHYYRRGVIGRPSYVVIYGDYSSKQEAMSAQMALPAALKKSSPWPRSFADIQRELRQRESK